MNSNDRIVEAAFLSYQNVDVRRALTSPDANGESAATKSESVVAGPVSWGLAGPNTPDAPHAYVRAVDRHVNTVVVPRRRSLAGRDVAQQVEPPLIFQDARDAAPEIVRVRDRETPSLLRDEAQRFLTRPHECVPGGGVLQRIRIGHICRGRAARDQSGGSPYRRRYRPDSACRASVSATPTAGRPHTYLRKRPGNPSDTRITDLRPGSRSMPFATYCTAPKGPHASHCVAQLLFGMLARPLEPFSRRSRDLEVAHRCLERRHAASAAKVPQDAIDGQSQQPLVGRELL